MGCSHDGINSVFKFRFRDVCGFPEISFEPWEFVVRQAVNTGRPFSIGAHCSCPDPVRGGIEALINPKTPLSLLKSLGGRRAYGVEGQEALIVVLFKKKQM